LSDRLDSEKRELARLEESRAEASRLLQETIEEKERRISQCDAREVETTKIKVDMQATMREVISDKEKVRRDQIAIENERSRLSEATERLAKTSRRVEEEAADVTARLHREERQLVKQKTLLDEDMRRVSLAKEELLRVRDEQENKSRELNEKEARLFSMSTEADSVRVRLKEEEERIVTWRAELDEEKRRILSTQEVLTEIEERGIENSRRDE
jgi:chromosome segregation ATPase